MVVGWLGGNVVVVFVWCVGGVGLFQWWYLGLAMVLGGVGVWSWMFGGETTRVSLREVMVCRWRWVVSVLVFGPGNGVGWSWGVVMDVWGRDD